MTKAAVLVSGRRVMMEAINSLVLQSRTGIRRFVVEGAEG